MFKGGFALGMMAKDLAVAAELADAMGSTSPTAHLVVSL